MFDAATGAELDRVYAVNVKGVFHCLKAGVSSMLADGKGGAIVNLASIASLIGLADRFSIIVYPLFFVLEEVIDSVLIAQEAENRFP